MDAVASRDLGTTTEITVEGDLDMSTVGELTARVVDAFGQEPERVVIDLRRVTFIDSSGLRCLIEARARGEVSRVDLVVLRPPPPVDRTFELCGLNDIFPVLGAAAGRRFTPSASEPYIADWA